MVANIPEGYKKTEVGVIPEDWDVKTCDQLGSFYKGKGISFNDVKADGYPCIMYGDIYVKFNIHFKKADFKINKNTASRSSRAKKGDLFFTSSGETAEEIGKCVSYQGEEDIYIGGDIIALTPNNNYNSLYLAFAQNSIPVIKQKSVFGQGHTVVHIYTEHIKSLAMPIPPLSEQQAIATALFDIDELIISITKLIDKKKNIKQGTMQELLTGKRRLIGFSSKWGKRTVNDIVVNISSGITSKKGETGKYVVFGSTGVIGYTNSYDYEGESILIARVGANAGRTNLVNGKYGVSDNALIINLVYNQNKLFWCYMLVNYGLNKLIFGSGQPLITGGQLKSLVFNCPMKEEQTQIATILSDMDIEIERLTQKLTKYKSIKQGMMQELLTGRIRLI